MFRPILCVLVGVLSIAAGAVECKLIRTPLPQTGWQNVQLRTANSDLTLLSGKIIPPAVRDDIEVSLKDPSMSFRDIANRASRILAQNQDILADHAELLRFLHDLLKRNELNTVYIDLPVNVDAWEARLKQMYLEIFQMQMHSSPNDVNLDRIILLAAGPVMYIRLVEPQAFDNVEVENMPSTPALHPERSVPQASPVPEERSPIPSARGTNPQKPQAPAEVREESPPRERKAGSQKDLRKAADDAFAELENKLSTNHSTLSSVREIRRELHNGKYDKLTIEEAKDRASARVWRQSRSVVREWVELEMKARKEDRRSAITATDFSARRRRRHETETPKETETTPPPLNLPKTKFYFSDQEVRDIAETLISRKGKAIGFLRQDWYDHLLKEYEALCTVK